jgi:hypothetical protein
MTKNREQGHNEGIQANVVKADVLAVGKGARAVKIVLSGSERENLLDAVAKLSQQIQSLGLEKGQIELLSRHAQDIKEAVNKPQVDSTEVQGVMEKFIKHLKQVGVAVKEMAGFVAPLQTIGGLLHISLSSLGLL